MGIETSNLNRQFLFRQSDVGQPKSSVATKVALQMNPALSAVALEVRVGADTEDTFDDSFWESLDCVVNALDNIQARLYVDSRCVWFAKPLLESGTLGTKANVQVILPGLTQSYGDSQDPPEETIPLCTLKHFPHAIEHTIEWARELFEQLFKEMPRDVNTFIANRDAYLSKASAEGSASQVARLNCIKRMLHQSMNSINPCVQFAVLEFQENFNHSIAQLLHTFPADHKTNEGTLFWSGPKRPPTPIVLNLENELHLDFVVAASNVLASTVGIPACRDREQIKLIASTVKNTEFKPKEMKIKVDDKDTARQLVKELSQTSGTAASANLTPAAFEKDDDSNFHVDFIYAASNLRAQNYKIPEAEKHRVKMIAGKIIPAIATTTAMVMGLVTAELLKVVTLKSRKLEEFKNGFVNLALPLWLLSEPMPPAKTVSKDFDPIIQGPVKAKPEGFTSWDKVVVNIPDGTLKQFLDHLSDEQNVETMIISSGNACLYNAYIPAHKKRMQTQLTKVWEDVTKQKLTDKKTYLTFEVSSSDLDTDMEVMLPTIKFVFR